MENTKKLGGPGFFETILVNEAKPLRRGAAPKFHISNKILKKNSDTRLLYIRVRG